MFTDSALLFNVLSQSLLVFLLALFIFSLFLKLIALSLFKKQSFQQPSQYDCEAQRFQLWLWVLLPWLAAVTSLIVISYNHFSIDSLLSEPPLLHFLHWHHLKYFSWWSWHGGLLLTALLFLVFSMYRASSIAWRHIQSERKSRMLSFLHGSDKALLGEVQQFEHDIPMAYTSGFFKPTTYLSSALVQASTSEQLALISLHERAHAKRFDPLQKLFFLFFASFYPAPLSQYLTERLALLMELSADQYLVKKGHNAFDIAHTLVQVSQRMSSSQRQSGLDQLKQRVDYLTLPNKKRGALLIASLLIPVFIVTLSIFSIDALHHGLDNLFRHYQ